MLHLDPSSFKTDKIFMELRFKESFKLPLSDTKYRLLDKFSKKYPAFNTDNPENIILANHDRQEQLFIQLNRIVIDWNKPKSMEDFIKSAQADSNFILKLLEVEDIIRIGTRTINSFQGSNQNAVTEFIFKQYITSKFKSSSFADEYFNPSVHLSGRKGKMHFNLTISYLQEQILEGTVNQLVNQQIRDLLAVDLDSYRENIKVSKMQSVFDEVKKINFNLPEYILSI
jgi:uncharacterized protein (TIGR04255 family)